MYLPSMYLITVVTWITTYLVGTVFKQQDNYPSILKEFSEDQVSESTISLHFIHPATALPLFNPWYVRPDLARNIGHPVQVDRVLEKQSTYTAETDKLVLEDETMRVQLIGQVNNLIISNIYLNLIMPFSYWIQDTIKIKTSMLNRLTPPSSWMV